MPPKNKDKKKAVIKSSNKSPLFARRNSPRKASANSADANVTENVNCSEREQNQSDCENAMIDPDCVWSGDKCITAADANKRSKPMPFTGSNDTSGNADGTDNDLTNSGQAAADKEAEAPKQAEAEKEVTPTGTPTGTPTETPTVTPAVTETPSPQEYTVSFEGTYDEEAKTFSGSLTIDGKEYTITSNPSMSSGVSSSSSPETDGNIAAIQKMLPAIPGITFNIQEV
jgi:hypothetical protein